MFIKKYYEMRLQKVWLKMTQYVKTRKYTCTNKKILIKKKNNCRNKKKIFKKN